MHCFWFLTLTLVFCQDHTLLNTYTNYNFYCGRYNNFELATSKYKRKRQYIHPYSCYSSNQKLKMYRQLANLPFQLHPADEMYHSPSHSVPSTVVSFASDERMMGEFKDLKEMVGLLREALDHQTAIISEQNIYLFISKVRLSSKLTVVGLLIPFNCFCTGVCCGEEIPLKICTIAMRTIQVM
ncbi:PREDICTED: uncharacterized protein LOC108362685 [Rhagoletis zephyria]|uniref:uncharacterized protein LOC108362685 n=1 Tax=Rhagoletis zephyria TaxID=28612 RepID=UPI000811499C|nr:PREDICTED: uncharacterized protein LOC108362685 [Rhagoletis zephyria]